MHSKALVPVKKNPIITGKLAASACLGISIEKIEKSGEGDMRQREVLEFRTPQHPSLGTNNWGGASPLLARNIPNESLDQRYARLNSIRTRDEIFPAQDDDFSYSQNPNKKNHAPKAKATKAEPPYGTPSRRGLLSKLAAWPRREKTTLGSWFPRWDPKNRWPQGWC